MSVLLHTILGFVIGVIVGFVVAVIKDPNYEYASSEAGEE